VGDHAGVGCLIQTPPLVPPVPATHVPFVPHVWSAKQQKAAAPTPHFLPVPVQVMLHSNLAFVGTASQIGVGFDPVFVEGSQRRHLFPQLSTLEFNRQVGVPAVSAPHWW